MFEGLKQWYNGAVRQKLCKHEDMEEGFCTGYDSVNGFHRWDMCKKCGMFEKVDLSEVKK